MIPLVCFSLHFQLASHKPLKRLEGAVCELKHMCSLEPPGRGKVPVRTVAQWCS